MSPNSSLLLCIFVASRVWAAHASTIEPMEAEAEAKAMDWPKEFPTFWFLMGFGDRSRCGRATWIPMTSNVAWELEKIDYGSEERDHMMERLVMQHCRQVQLDNSYSTFIRVDLSVLMEVVYFCGQGKRVCEALWYSLNTLELAEPRAEELKPVFALHLDLQHYLASFELQHPLLKVEAEEAGLCRDRFGRPYRLPEALRACILIEHELVLPQDVVLESVMPRSVHDMLTRIRSHPPTHVLRTNRTMLARIFRTPTPTTTAHDFSQPCLFYVGSKAPSPDAPTGMFLLCAYGPQESHLFLNPDADSYVCPEGFHAHLSYHEHQGFDDFNMTPAVEFIEIDKNSIRFNKVCFYMITVSSTEDADGGVNAVVDLRSLENNTQVCNDYAIIDSRNLAVETVQSVLVSFCPYELWDDFQFCISYESTESYIEMDYFFKTFLLDHFTRCAHQTTWSTRHKCFFYFEPKLGAVLRLPATVLAWSGLETTLAEMAGDDNCLPFYMKMERFDSKFTESPDHCRLPFNDTLHRRQESFLANNFSFSYDRFLEVYDVSRTIYICTCASTNCELNQNASSVQAKIDQEMGFRCHSGNIVKHEHSSDAKEVPEEKTDEMFCFFSAVVEKNDDQVKAVHEFAPYDYQNAVMRQIDVSMCITAADWDRYYNGSVEHGADGKPTLYRACRKIEETGTNHLHVVCCCIASAREPACNSLKRLELAVDLADELQHPESVPVPFYCQEEGINVEKVDQCDPVSTRHGTAANMRCYFIYKIEAQQVVLEQKGCYVPWKGSRVAVEHFCHPSVFNAVKETFVEDRFCSSGIVDMPNAEDAVERRILVCCDPHPQQGSKNDDWLDVDDNKLPFFAD